MVFALWTFYFELLIVSSPLEYIKKPGPVGSPCVAAGRQTASSLDLLLKLFSCLMDSPASPLDQVRHTQVCGGEIPVMNAMQNPDHQSPPKGMNTNEHYENKDTLTKRKDGPFLVYSTKNGVRHGVRQSARPDEEHVIHVVEDDEEQVVHVVEDEDDHACGRPVHHSQRANQNKGEQANRA